MRMIARALRGTSEKHLNSRQHSKQVGSLCARDWTHNRVRRHERLGIRRVQRVGRVLRANNIHQIQNAYDGHSTQIPRASQTRRESVCE